MLATFWGSKVADSQLLAMGGGFKEIFYVHPYLTNTFQMG